MSKVKISVEQLQQLIDWAGAEPHTQVTIERTDGDEGPGLYAFNSDHPEEGAIRLDEGEQSAPEGKSVSPPWSPPMLDGPRPPIAGACVSPGKLRAMVKHSFESAHDPDDAALRICVAIDAELGLSGNGWFDDDPAVLVAGGSSIRGTADAVDTDAIAQLQLLEDLDYSLLQSPPLTALSVDGRAIPCLSPGADPSAREAYVRRLFDAIFDTDESEELDGIPAPASGTLH
ncbi:hypothetical protein K7573_20955 (plasmid) [Stenotrophomonas maltophilia]|uniref:hypothetical protein n=1 Tax=Stenotrophomonas maltophilia TaxID=40324 RepID=UPI001D100DFF|nr:hypothetical protein [Stenotrophomonas maltophilia]UXF78751.1 hypothetical protein K7573_20955 [Stenotrophomonas maltophilia]